jgi:DnaJ-class molecular chaperone
MLTKWIQCPSCEGRGEVEYEVAVPMGFSNPYGYLTSEWDVCDHCRGRGEIEVDDDADDE